MRDVCHGLFDISRSFFFLPLFFLLSLVSRYLLSPFLLCFASDLYPSCSCSGSYPGLPTSVTCTYVLLLVHIPGRPFLPAIGIMFFLQLFLYINITIDLNSASAHLYYNCRSNPESRDSAGDPIVLFRQQARTRPFVSCIFISAVTRQWWSVYTQLPLLTATFSPALRTRRFPEERQFLPKPRLTPTLTPTPNNSTPTANANNTGNELPIDKAMHGVLPTRPPSATACPSCDVAGRSKILCY